MLNVSFWIITTGLFAMIAASVLLYFDSLTVVAYTALVIGFFAIGIGILLGFYRMVREDEQDRTQP